MSGHLRFDSENYTAPAYTQRPSFDPRFDSGVENGLSSTWSQGTSRVLGPHRCPCLTRSPWFLANQSYAMPPNPGAGACGSPYTDISTLSYPSAVANFPYRMGACPTEPHLSPLLAKRAGKAKKLRSLLDDIVGEDALVTPFPFTHPLPRYTRCYGSLARFDWEVHEEGGPADLSSRACGLLLNDIMKLREQRLQGSHAVQKNGESASGQELTTLQGRQTMWLPNEAIQAERDLIAPIRSPGRRTTSRRGSSGVRSRKDPACSKVQDYGSIASHAVFASRTD